MLECTQDMKQTQNRHLPMNKHTQWKKGARTWPREKIHVEFLFPAMFEGQGAGVKQTIKHYWCWGRTWGGSESVDALHRVRMIRGAWGLHHHCSFQLPDHTRPYSTYSTMLEHACYNNPTILNNTQPCLNMLVPITQPRRAHAGMPNLIPKTLRGTRPANTVRQKHASNVTNKHQQGQIQSNPADTYHSFRPQTWSTSLDQILRSL